MTPKNMRKLEDMAFKVNEVKLSKQYVKPEDVPKRLKMKTATLSEGRVGLAYACSSSDAITLTTYARMSGGLCESIQLIGEKQIGRFLRYMGVYNAENLEGKAVIVYTVPYPWRESVCFLKKNE